MCLFVSVSVYCACARKGHSKTILAGLRLRPSSAHMLGELSPHRSFSLATHLSMRSMTPVCHFCLSELSSLKHTVL